MISTCGLQNQHSYWGLVLVTLVIHFLFFSKTFLPFLLAFSGLVYMLSSIFFPKGSKTNTEIYTDVHPCGCQLDHNIKPILHAVSLAVWFHDTEPVCTVHELHFEGGIYSSSGNVGLDPNSNADTQLSVLGKVTSVTENLVGRCPGFHSQ